MGRPDTNLIDKVKKLEKKVEANRILLEDLLDAIYLVLQSHLKDK